jgi:hypothetical protein
LARVSEAQFLGLLKLRKSRSADGDLRFLALRVFGPEVAVREDSVDLFANP